MTLHALGRHVALVGFMGAGKTTLAARLGKRLGRPVVDVDREIELRAGKPVAQIFEQDGEAGFRRIEARAIGDAVERRRPAVLDLGGGAVTFEENEAPLGEVFTLLVELDVGAAWRRVRRTDRPLAQDERMFRALYEERAPRYREVADAVVRSGDLDGAVLAAAGVCQRLGALDRLGELVPGDGPVALVSEPTVLALYGARAEAALGDRLVSRHELPAGEEAKSWRHVQRLWSELRLDRDGTIVALGGGALTDPAGFAAATYLRGVPWVAVPTTLVGQVDAAIGGKTAIDIPEGKNLVGAFHWPARVVIDETVLETLPERERRQGLAELVKTQLLVDAELDVRGAAAYKSALCLRDPQDRDVRRFLNLGHTFAHALEAAADFDLPHGEAVALGLLAALRVSGRDTKGVESALDPQPVTVDRERAWNALGRDKKRSGGEINLVLLGDDGPYIAARPAAEVRAALDTLIAG